MASDPAHDASLVELNSVKYELATIKEERERDKLLQEQALRELKQQLQDEGKLNEQEKIEKNFLFERQKTLAEELIEVKCESGKVKV